MIVGGKRIAEATGDDRRRRVSTSSAASSSRPPTKKIAERPLKEVRDRLRFLAEVGLDYLGLDRRATTLSGGEAQRIRLATQIGSRLTGVLYVLDEPTIGLHQRDVDRLLGTLGELKSLGNTVVVVEHDEETMERADWIVDLGPGAGHRGGEVVYQGPRQKLLRDGGTLTADYLTGKRSILVPEKRRRGQREDPRASRRPKTNNLKNVDFRLPLGTLQLRDGRERQRARAASSSRPWCPQLERTLRRSPRKSGIYKKLVGARHVSDLVVIDQTPIGKHSQVEPGDLCRRLRSHPPGLRDGADGADEGLQARAFQLQCAGWSLRGLLRSRLDQASR